MVRIVIDPGHGGAEKIGGSSPNNAHGPAGALEKDLTLSISLMTAGLLSNLGHEVRLTRAKDENVGLAERARVAFDFEAKVFVSIHLNGWHEPTVQGTETLHAPDASEASKALAAAVQKRVVAATGYRDRGVKPQELGVLKIDRHRPETAACLSEASFLTDPQEEQRLIQESYQVKLATAICDGVQDYLAEFS